MCAASGGPHLLASCFILSSTLMWNWEEFPRPSTATRRVPPCFSPLPMLSSSQTHDEGFCGPCPHKKNPELHASPWQLASPEMKNCWMRLLAGVRG